MNILPKDFEKLCLESINQDMCFLFHVIFHVFLQNLFAKTGNFSSNWLLLSIADLIVTPEGIVNIKTWVLSDLTHCTICGKLFKTYSLQNHERNHTKQSIFKHFGLSVPDLRKLNPARIRLRMTQKIILHGEPAFLKQSPLVWTGVVTLQNGTCEQLATTTTDF